MGGQACVFYGAAEFSRDTDFAILADAANLAKLRAALADLQAENIAVPPFEILAHGAPHARVAAGNRAVYMRSSPDVSPPSGHCYSRPPSASSLNSNPALAAEENSLRAQDKAYWLPLREELERLRHAK